MRDEGVGVAASILGIAIATIRRYGVGWEFKTSASALLSEGDSSLRRAQIARELWSVHIRVHIPMTLGWFGILDPWGLVSGAGAGNKTNRDSRRLVLMIGQIMGWALDASIEPVLFEPGELRRNLGAQVDSDNKRLGACVAGFVQRCPQGLSALEIEAVATAVMAGRHSMAPAVLTKGKRA